MGDVAEVGDLFGELVDHAFEEGQRAADNGFGGGRLATDAVAHFALKAAR